MVGYCVVEAKRITSGWGCWTKEVLHALSSCPQARSGGTKKEVTQSVEVRMLNGASTSWLLLLVLWAAACRVLVWYVVKYGLIGEMRKYVSLTLSCASLGAGVD
jgi:hypothetical protein